MTFTFLKAKGYEVGKSLVESDKIELANKLMEEANQMKVQLVLPDDIIVADKLSEDANCKNVSIENIPNDWMGVDIGENTIKNILRLSLIQKQFSGMDHLAFLKSINFPKVLMQSQKLWQTQLKMAQLL